jgi:integrase
MKQLEGRTHENCDGSRRGLHRIARVACLRQRTQGGDALRGSVLRNATGPTKRNVPLTDRVAKMLLERSLESQLIYDFPSDTGRPYCVTSIDHDYAKVRAKLGVPSEFVIYSLRRTYGTRLGEAGADAFTIMRLMGHSSVTAPQRYVHPSPEALERAVERLQAMNAAKSFPEGENGQKRLEATTIPTTVESKPSVGY